MNVIKYYILGYLNVYYMNYYGLYGKTHETYKEFKISKLTSYLNLSPSVAKTTLRIINVLILLEVPLSVILLTLRFIQCFITCPFVPFKRKENENLLIGAGEVKTKQLLSTTDIDKDSIIIIKIPYISEKIYNGLSTLSVFSGIRTGDVIKSYVKSIKTILVIRRKYGKRDFLTRSYSSFEYYLGYYYICRASHTNTFFFTSTYSRWAFLHGHTDHKTVFLQHGWISDKTTFLNKIGTVDRAYYISEQQKKTCEYILFNNKPEAFYLKGLKYNIYPEKDKINILLICESTFMQRQLEIIETISKNKNLRLYVKPHPKDKDLDVYNSLKEKCNFILLQGYNFPEVDYVISYESTLAVEYEMNGVKTLIYDRDEYERQYCEIVNMEVRNEKDS